MTPWPLPLGLAQRLEPRVIRPKPGGRIRGPGELDLPRASGVRIFFRNPRPRRPAFPELREAPPPGPEPEPLSRRPPTPGPSGGCARAGPLRGGCTCRLVPCAGFARLNPARACLRPRAQRPAALYPVWLGCRWGQIPLPKARVGIRLVGFQEERGRRGLRDLPRVGVDGALDLSGRGALEPFSGA